MKIRIHVQDGPKAYDFENAGPTIGLGRNPAGHIVLEKEAAESVVSWEHARIDMSPREATLTDLRSTNGTYRNGTPVKGTVPLGPNDVIRLGQTGPTLTVTAIDLNPAAKPAPQLIGVAAAKPFKAAKPQAAKAVMSETRGIALQAVQDLMAQQEELRAQHEAQTRHRRALMGVALVALVFFLLLGGGLFRYTDYFNRRADAMAGDIGKTQEDLIGLDENMRKMAADSAVRFGKLDQDLTEQKETQDKTQQAVEKVLAEQAKVQGGLEKLKKDLGASLDDINRRLTDKPANAPDAAPRGGKPGGKAAASSKPSARIEPGMKMDVIMRDGVSTYKGVLRDINGTMVHIQTNPNSDKPSEFDMKKVQAFQTRDGIFAYNDATGEFESAITYFRFNKSSGMFERTEDQQEPYRMEDAQVLGPVTVRALWGPGPGGWILGLPGAGGQTPPPMEAYQLKEIWTVKGVYTYDQSKQDYRFESRSDLAADAREKRTEMFKEMDKKDWERRVKSYELGTERLKAMSHYFWRRWW